MTSSDFVQLLLDESKWFAFSLAVAAIGSTIAVYVKSSAISSYRRTELITHLLFGITIGTMAFGHLLAITIKLWLGTLEGSIPLLYLLGFAIGIPSWLLIYKELQKTETKNSVLVLNLWVATTLLTAGLTNIPLAIPGFLNAIRKVSKRKEVKIILLWAVVIIYIFLLIGSINFAMSGGSFEDFSGMDD